MQRIKPDHAIKPLTEFRVNTTVCFHSSSIDSQILDVIQNRKRSNEDPWDNV